MTPFDKGKIRLIFWGTPEFAVPALAALLDAKYRVIAVVSNPDEPMGRTSTLTAPPVKKFAHAHHLHVLQPATLANDFFRNELPDADLFVVAAYGKIIPPNILSRAPMGILNIHPSLLPCWRGPSPIQFTILHGDTVAGVSVMLMDERMDHGPVLAAETGPISSQTTYSELHDILAKKGAALLLETIPRWISKEILPIPQNDNTATYSKILKKDDGRIDWKKSANEIDRQIRAFTPWPGAWTLWPAKEKIFRIRVEKAHAVSEESMCSPGSVVTRGDRLLVQTGKGMLRVETITIAGKKSSLASSFLRGHPEIGGSIFI